MGEAKRKAQLRWWKIAAVVGVVSAIARACGTRRVHGQRTAVEIVTVVVK